jgi:hypothetical protein
MAWLVLWCVALGLFPNVALRALDTVSHTLTGAGLPATALEAGMLWLVPSTQTQASYGPLVFLLVITLVVVFTYFAVRWCFHGRMRRAPPWDCGFPEQTPRMQDSSDGFGQSIRQIFAPIFRIRRSLPRPDDREPRFEVSVDDRHWYLLYLPVARLVVYLSAKVGALQQGRIGVYLLYSFVTLIALLVFVRWSTRPASPSRPCSRYSRFWPPHCCSAG